MQDTCKNAVTAFIDRKKDKHYILFNSLAQNKKKKQLYDTKRQFQLCTVGKLVCMNTLKYLRKAGDFIVKKTLNIFF